MSLQFTINKETFIIDKFDDGYAWTSNLDESTQGFETEVEAQQDAIQYASKREQERKNAKSALETIFGEATRPFSCNPMTYADIGEDL